MYFICLRIFLCLSILFCFKVTANEGPSPKKIKTLFAGLDPNSVVQNLAFYDLYSKTTEGKMALDRAISLLSTRETKSQEIESPLYLPESAIDAMISLVDPTHASALSPLSACEIDWIESFASTLKNRKLKGNQAQSEQEVLKLNPEEVDLARGLLISQLGNSEESWRQIRTYEAVLDLMALQVRARFQDRVTPEQAIRELNRYIFEELQFRFPPHSSYAKDIDLYSFLPSVIESRRGVCLGVSILYLCLGQRLGIPLEIITPPGHIYVRYNDGKKIINIETTARGIHLDSEEYLGINTLALQKRNIKETIGMAHFNKAGGLLTQCDYEKALKAYESAFPYFPEDRLVKELMAYCYLNLNQEEIGYALLKETNEIDPYVVAIDPLLEDLLQRNADSEDISAIFMHVDETRESLLKKFYILKTSVAKHPKFRMGWYYLGIALLQLHREHDALEALETYHMLDPHNPTVEYYLAILNAQRFDYNKSWEHLRAAEEAVRSRNHYPKVLKDLRFELTLKNPEYRR